MAVHLGRAKPKEVTREYITVDIETRADSVYGSALLGETVFITWCENGQGYGEKSNDLTMWLLNTFLTPKYDGFICYAHNGFGFDMKRVDFQLLVEYGYTAEFTNGKDGSIKSVTLRLLSGEWIIRDSLLLIPRKLDDVTKKFAPNVRKIKREKSFDEAPFNPDNEADREYAIRDAVGLWYAIQTVDNLLRERFQVSIHESPTLPGLAYRAFRLMFEKGDKKNGIESEKYPGLSFGVAYASRESYHGGQTIAFKTNAIRDVVSLDANSMYSHVMLHWGLPTGTVRKVAGLSPLANPDKTLCFAICHIPHGVFPLLKTKDKKGKTGNYRGVVSGWYWMFELEKQRQLGATYQVIESYEWETTTDCAKRFIALCRDLRMEKDNYFGAIGELAKLLSNALYGKFAQSAVEFSLCLSKEQPDESFPVYNPAARSLVPGLWNVKSKPIPRADMTHWASFITAKARMVLNEAIEKAGYDNIIYCDTDSIFIERSVLPRVQSIMGKEYGKFKIEKGSESKGIPFQAIAPKAYLFIETDNKIKVKNKGIPTHAIMAQDGISRMGGQNESVEFISSNNLFQMIKSGKDYGRKAKRRMATVYSTTNGMIVNDQWQPVECELPSIEEIRGDSTLNNKTPFYVKKRYDRIIEDFKSKGDKIG